MLTIDADAHVIENEATWDYLEGSDRRFRPTEDNLMIGSDYGHADNASELLALKGIRDKGEIAPAIIDKILAHNPARFYGLAED